METPASVPAPTPGAAFSDDERAAFDILTLGVHQKKALLVRCHTSEGNIPKAVVVVRTVSPEGRHKYSPVAVLLSPKEALATLKPTFLEELGARAVPPDKPE